jgi:hypothetical protein
MADNDGGFGIGFIVGGAIGFAVGAWLASGPGRDRVELLRERTIELTNRGRDAVSNPETPLGKAVQDGFSAARRRRTELESGGGPVSEAAPEGM